MHELADGSVALTVTSPPYWNAIDYDIHASDKAQYYRTRAASRANGYSEYADYLDWLERIFGEERRVTKPGGLCAVMDVANNVWHIAPVPPDFLDHPCPFPEEIPHRLISLYSYPGDLVLDPFAGSGQTLKVARGLDRQFVDYEIIPKYVKLAVRRIDEPQSIRPQQLIAVFQKVGLDDPAGGASQTDNGRREKVREESVEQSS